MDAFQFLVIILSAVLAIFLIVSTILVLLVIRVMRQVQRVAISAERTVEGVSGVVAGIGQFTSPALIARSVFRLVKKYRQK